MSPCRGRSDGEGQESKGVKKLSSSQDRRVEMITGL